MRKGWEYKKLGEVCDVYQPKTLSTDMLSKDGEYPVYGANGIIGYYHQYNHEDKEVLLTCRGATCGNINVSKPYSWINGNAMVIHRKSEFIDFDFLKYMMLSLDYSLIITGAAQPQITRQKLAPIKIAIPPKSTQLAIVSELDKINELIRLKKEQLKDFDNLAQSLFYEMFGDPVENEKGWEVKKLGEIGEVKTGNTPSRSNDNFYNEKFIEWIKTDNIRNEQMNPTTAAEYLSRDGAECGRIVSKGSILVACIAGSLSSIGKCCITTKNVAFNQQINAITPYGDFCNSIYLYELIRNSYKYIQQNATTGMKHILSKSIFEKMKFPLPPLSLQRLFAQRIEQIEREKSEVQKSIQDLETLLASRMQYWFE